MRAASKNDAIAVGSLGEISKRVDLSIVQLGPLPTAQPLSRSEPSSAATNPTSDVGRLEWILFGAFCLLLCAVPVISHLLLSSMPK